MENNLFTQFGNNILNALNKQGKSQQYLASELGVSKQVMSKIITGAKAINVVEISKIASVLNVSVDSLLETKKPQPKMLVHNLAYMGEVKNPETRKKIEIVKTIIEEIVMLEEYFHE